jgi:hypothetical protein
MKVSSLDAAGNKLFNANNAQVDEPDNLDQGNPD